MQTPASTKYHHFQLSPEPLPSGPGKRPRRGECMDPAGAIGAGGADGAIAAVSGRSLTPGAGAAVGCAAKARAMISFAATVPSAPQAGHATGDAMRPSTGSTSKA